MASYKDLMKLMREGCSAGEIMERLELCPSRLRRMLAGKRLAAAMAAEEELARRIVRHQLATGVQTAARKMRELIESNQSETMRKACLTLLSEGLSLAWDSPPPAEKSGEEEEESLPVEALEYSRDGEGDY